MSKDNNLPQGSVEKYIRYKGWDFRQSGNQFLIEVCPFCLNIGYTFFINSENGLWDCKRGKCQRKGNFYQLLQTMGDLDHMPKRTSSWDDEEDEDAPRRKAPAELKGVADVKNGGTKERERIPNVEDMHATLMADEGWVNALNDTRGWDFDVLKTMKIGLADRDIEVTHGVYKSLRCLVYPYYTGKACNFVKFRTVPASDFEALGIPEGFKGFSSLRGWDVPLYNSACVEKGMEYLLLVEGEADTLSVLSLGEKSVAGVPGAGTQKITWDALLDLPKKKYLLFDNDEAGQLGAKKFAERFGNAGFYNIKLPAFEMLFPKIEDGEERTQGKDIGEWIEAGGTLDELKQLMAEAREFDVEGVNDLVTSLRALRQQMVENGGAGMKYDSPWFSLNAKFGGAEDGHLIIVQAPEKTGKTTLALNWGDYLTDRNGGPKFDDNDELIPWQMIPHPLNENVYLECLEMDSKQLSRKWFSYKTQTSDDPRDSKLNPEIIERGVEIAQSMQCNMLFGEADYNKLEDVFERWKIIIRRYGVKVFIFDNLQLLVDMLWTGERMGGRHAFMSRVTKKIKRFASANHVLFILLAQSRRGEGSDAVSTSNSLEGSGSPAKDCDTMVTANRVKTNQAKNSSELEELVEMETEAAQSPIMYLDVGLSRFASGGICKLFVEGALSTIRELKDSEKAARQVAINAEKSKVSWTDGKGKPNGKKKAAPPVVPDVKLVDASGEAVAP